MMRDFRELEVWRKVHAFEMLKPDVMEVNRMLSGFINTLKGTLKSRPMPANG